MVAALPAGGTVAVPESTTPVATTSVHTGAMMASPIPWVQVGGAFELTGPVQASALLGGIVGAGRANLASSSEPEDASKITSLTFVP
jgi:hypothetical protein